MYSRTVFIQVNRTCHLIDTFSNPYSILTGNLAQYTIKFPIRNFNNHVVGILDNMTPSLCIATQFYIYALCFQLITTSHCNNQRRY